MSRIDANRSGDMEAFVAVVEAGGLSAAARALDMTPSAISKLLARLEARLGARLVNRTTRKLTLTPEGDAFYESARRILGEIDDAERLVSGEDTPSGRVRINTSASYGTHVLAPILGDFLDRHRRISVEVIQTDTVVDLVSERADIAIRAGPLQSSSLMARKLGDTRLIFVASPDYLARRGAPQTPDDFKRHDRLDFTYRRALSEWRMRTDKREVPVDPAVRVKASDGEALRLMAIQGMGIARQATFTCQADLAAGRLVEILPDRMVIEVEAFHAVYLGQGGPVPARVRALLDYLAEHGRIT
ncbi:DNA-binding transcriptional LysR family regulator [Rhizobium sp. SG_E_25_P2]|uniref:LysR family transcriptional regulator n=1 Tax=Rhizobium sp. SG_E_25_P2 TaxID=2879942 RepID=UPI002475AA6F|nr:LysR family transcriptional regulator [Rhizobium sp. SG_E_25_P2]MDH6266846.1 DNA-binding transcriptional LysR family regulator [Rhizobium sp. SG_E_25_P2]